MQRDKTSIFNKWLDDPVRKPLILRGARQVGKSTLVKDFSTTRGLTLHEVNLERYGQLRDVVLSMNPATFLQEVQLICRKGQVDREGSLLFIDEIQAIPEALQLLRYLYEEFPTLPVIAAGSLLEFALEKTDFSMPVGRVEYCFLGPCLFKEFIKGLGETELYQYISKYNLSDPFSAVAHEKLSQLLRLFLLIGGMPEAVQRYIDTRDFNEVARVHASLVATYRDDFSKYSSDIPLSRLQQIFDYAPVGLGKKIKYVNIDPDAQSRDLKKPLKLLEMANVITPAYVSNALLPPLGAAKDHEKFKFYFLDCGLINSISGNTLVPSLLNDKFINEGALAEQFIAQHLLQMGKYHEKPALYYWLREGKSDNAEVDFLIQHEGAVVPIEVKAGLSGTLKSLHQFISRSNNSLAIRFDLNPPSIQNVTHTLNSDPTKSISFSLLSLPLYLVEELPRLIINI